MFRSCCRSCCARAGGWRPREGWLRRFCKLLSSCMFPIGRARSSVATRISEVYDAFIAAARGESPKGGRSARRLRKSIYADRFRVADPEMDGGVCHRIERSDSHEFISTLIHRLFARRVYPGSGRAVYSANSALNRVTAPPTPK